MADIRCLVCARLNDENAERCWFCHSLLPKATGPLTRQERENLAYFYKKQPLVKTFACFRTDKRGERPHLNLPKKMKYDWLAGIRKLKEEDESPPCRRKLPRSR
jgi:hypothetical protein